MNALVETLNRYGVYLNTGDSCTPFDLIYNTLEVCEETGLKPLVLCNATHAKHWKIVLAITKRSAEVCDDYVNEDFAVSAKFIEAQDLLVVFHANLPSFTHVAKIMTGIIMGVTRYGKKFCIIGEASYRVCDLFMAILRSVHPRDDSWMDTSDRAYVMDELAKYDIKPNATNIMDLRKAIDARFVIRHIPKRTGCVKKYQHTNSFIDTPKVVIINEDMCGAFLPEYVEQFVESSHGVLVVDDTALGMDIICSLGGNVVVMVHRRHGTSPKPRSGTVNMHYMCD